MTAGARFARREGGGLVNPVVAWLESDEGEAWRLRHFVSPLTWHPGVIGSFALPPLGFQPGHVMRGPVDPAHDPCGRPPCSPC